MFMFFSKKGSDAGSNEKGRNSLLGLLTSQITDSLVPYHQNMLTRGVHLESY